LEKYSSYKDSGIDWIGKIPENWDVIKTKYFTNQEKNKTETGDEELLSVSEYKGVIPRRSIRSDDEPLTRSESLVGYLKVNKGELVSNIMLMWKRGLGVSDYDGIVSPSYSVFSFNEGFPKYFHYLFRTDLYITEFRKNSTGVIESRLRLYDDKFGSIYSHFPPLPEQKRIVTYLDEKTSKIDRLIQSKQRKIKLLKEKRTSLINELVTKGLNSDVEMRDSGVEWYEKIPKHWMRGKLSYHTSRIGDGLHSTPKYVDESEYKFINGNNLINGRIKYFESTKSVSKDEYEKHYIELTNKTVLLSINGTIGNLSFYNGEKVILGKSSCYINCQDTINRSYLYYLLGSDSIMKYFTFELTGTTIYNLSLESVRNTPIPIPPLDEQKEIVQYLNSETNTIDKTVKLETDKIDLLKEYKQSLISEVVTGKVNVQEEVDEVLV